MTKSQEVEHPKPENLARALDQGCDAGDDYDGNDYDYKGGDHDDNNYEDVDYDINGDEM